MCETDIFDVLASVLAITENLRRDFRLDVDELPPVTSSMSRNERDISTARPITKNQVKQSSPSSLLLDDCKNCTGVLLCASKLRSVDRIRLILGFLLCSQ
jgi:hypothetical protein